MKGTLSLGIYDKKGRLVRVLHREATEKDFTVGLNGFVTHWDGKDDAGKPAPRGDYGARGYCVGAVEVEGVALHGNDWIADDDSPRYAGVTDIRARSADEVEVALKTLDGAEKTAVVAFAKEHGAGAALAFSAKVADGKVAIVRGDETRDFPLGEGEAALDASVGAGETLWLIVKNAAGSEVREYSIAGEFLRRLAYTPDEPPPRRIVASPHDEQIVLLEENAALQRVRSLVLSASAADEAASIWKTVFEKPSWSARPSTP